MNTSRQSQRVFYAVAVAMAGISGGCEMDSYFSPSTVGRWEFTPVKLPILKRLDLIDEDAASPPNVTEVMPEDLIPFAQAYVIGPGDVAAVSVFELLQANAEMAVQRAVDDLGILRHPILGPIKLSGLTEVQAEQRVARLVIAKGYLKVNPQVTVLVVGRQQNTYSLMGPPGRVTRMGQYLIRNADFRLLDATSQGGGIDPSVKEIFIYRQAKAGTDQQLRSAPDPQPQLNPTDIILDLLENKEPSDGSMTAPAGQPPPEILDRSVEDDSAIWINVDNKWVQAPRPTPPTSAAAQSSAADESALPQVPQRVIRVPFNLLREGDLRYNVVIRAGDIIKVPEPGFGNVYLFGAIARPGTYGLPGSERLTLKQMIAAAGGFNTLGVPERVDLVRRIGDDHEATVRLNLREIFNGTEPDIFLKANDLINIGTNLPMTPLAVVRGGFRSSYGFGFVLDRNFGFDVFGSQNRGIR